MEIKTRKLHNDRITINEPQETNKRKAIMRSVPLEEIKEFNDNYKENKLKNEKEQQIKRKNISSFLFF